MASSNMNAQQDKSGDNLEFSSYLLGNSREEEGPNQISPDKRSQPQNSAFNRGYVATEVNQLEMSLESSFFDGSSFIEDVGGKALVNMNTQNLEELLQADDVDPVAFLIKSSRRQ